MEHSYRRPQFETLVSRLTEPRGFIQILAGPRQIGKTTLALQALSSSRIRHHYASGDEPTLRDREWLQRQWDTGRELCLGSESGGLLVLDEIQKIPDWSEAVKRLWDEDSLRGVPLKVLMLGSSPLLLRKGLSDSLAGRFEVIPLTHWGFAEMKQAFGWDFDTFLFFGGYPGGVRFIKEPVRWARYVLDSLVESTLSRDVLLMSQINKPILLRRLLEIACLYSGRVLSYQRMLGQLQDAGNTTTLAHYLETLGQAGLVTGLQKYAGETFRQRASSPKLVVLNTALMTAMSGLLPEQAWADPVFRGHLVESCVGGYLVGATAHTPIKLFYWASGNHEVDFVLSRGRRIVAIEVKSGRQAGTRRGFDRFLREFGEARTLMVGADGIPVEKFIQTPVDTWFD